MTAVPLLLILCGMRKRWRTAVAAGIGSLLIAAVVLLALLAGRQGGEAYPRFRVEDADGIAVDPARLHGRVAMIFFGYTGCPDVCPTELGWMRRVIAALGEDVALVVPMMVGVDRQRDPAPRLAAYAQAFDRRILACTADEETVRAMATAFGAGFRRRPAGPEGGYLVDHTAVTFILAPDGRLVDRLGSRMDPSDAARRIRAYLPPANTGAEAAR